MRKYYYLIWMFLVAVSVPFVFRWIQPRSTAALVAGLLFLSVGFAGLWSQRKARGLLGGLERGSQIVFLIGFAAPIFFMRVLNWGVPFAELQWWGHDSTFWHNLSPKFYGIMLALGLAYHISEKLKGWLLRKTKK